MIRTLMMAAVVVSGSVAMAGPGCGGGGAKASCGSKAQAAVAVEAAAAPKSDCSKGEAKTEAEKEACARKCSDKEKAAKAALTSAMPKLLYKIGDKTTCCADTAESMAEEAGVEMSYVVNGVEFADKAQAVAAHSKQLQDYMIDLVRVQYAPGESDSPRYKVGPVVFDSAEEAIRASVMAWNASRKVSMEYAVGDKMAGCSKSAGAMASNAGGKVEYVVNGKRTGCAKTADYMQTMARVESALKAIESVKSGDA